MAEVKVKVDFLVKQAQANAASLNKSVLGLGAAFAGLKLAGAALSGVTKAFGATIGAANKLQAEVAEIGTLLGEDAVTQTKKLTGEILNLQKTFGAGTADSAKALYQAISSGAVNAEESIKLMTTANKLAIGGVTDVATAVDGITNSINGFALKAEDSTRIADTFFEGMKAGKTTIAELSQNIGKVAASANGLGISLEETVAAMSTLTTTGISTSEATTKVKAAITALVKPNKELAAALEKAGIASVESAIKQDGLQATLKRITDTTDGSATAIKGLFSSVEAGDAVLAIASSSSETYSKTLGNMNTAMKNSGEATERAFKKIADTTEFRLKQARGQIDATATQIGVAFSPAYEALLTATSTVFTEVAKFVDANKEVIKQWGVSLATSVNNAVEGFKRFVDFLISNKETIIAVGSAVGVIVTAFGTYAVAIGAAKAATAAFGAVMAVVGSPILLTVAAIAALVGAGVALYRNWDTVVKFAKDLGLMLLKNLNPAFETVIDIVHQVIRAFDFMKGAILKMGALYLNFVGSVLTRVVSGFDKVLGAIGTVASIFNSDLGDSIERARRSIRGFSENLDESAKAMDRQGDALIEGAIDGDKYTKSSERMKGKTQELIKEFENSTTSLGKQNDAVKTSGETYSGLTENYDKVQDSLEDTSETFGKTSDDSVLFGESVGNVSSKVETASGEIQESSSKMSERFVGNVSSMSTSIEDIPKVTAESVSESSEEFNKFPEVVKAGNAAILESTKKTGSKLIAENKKGAESNSNFWSDAFVEIGSAGATLVSNISNSFTSLVSDITSMGAGIFNFFDNFTKIDDDGNFLILDSIKALVETAKRIPKVIAENGDEILDMFLGIVDELIDVMPALIDALVKAVPKFAKAIIKIVEKVVKALPDILKRLSKGIKSILKEVVKAMPTIIKALVGGMKDIIVEVVSLVPDIIDAILRAVPYIIIEVSKSIGPIIKSLGKAMPKVVTAFAENVGPIISALAKATPEIIKAIANNVLPIIQSIIKELPKIITALVRSMPQIIDALSFGVMKAAADFGKEIYNSGKNFISSIASGVSAFVSGVANAIGSFVSGIYNAVGSFTSGVYNAISGFASGIYNAVGSFASGVYNAASNFVSKAVSAGSDFAVSLWNKGVNIFKSLGEQIWGGFKGVFNIGSLFRGAWGKGTVEKWMGIDIPFIRFAEGGPVGGTASVMGNSFANDKVPALLSPGEFVLDRETMAGGLPSIIEKLGGSGVVQKFGFGGWVKDLIGKAAGILPNVWSLIKRLGGSIYDVAKKLISSGANVDLWGVVTNPRKALTNALKGILTNIVPMKGILSSAFAGYSQGGLVGGNSMVAGDSKVNDIIPALLSAGEMVIPKTAVNQGLGGVMSFASNVLSNSNSTGFTDGAFINTTSSSGNTNIMDNNGMDRLVTKLDEIKVEVTQTGFAVAKNTSDIRKIAKRWDIQGLPSTRE